MTESEAMEKAFSKAFDEGCKVKTNSGYFGGDTDEKTRVMYKSIWDSAIAYSESQWVRCDERLPKKKGRYIWQFKDGEIDAFDFSDKNDRLWTYAVAWRPLPAPYTGESK